MNAGGLGGPGGPPFLNIRGISFVDFSNINEGSVGLYVDDVYQVAQGAGVAQTYDIQRVETLRGPQGTLFGRNTTAGVIHYVTRKAEEDYLNGNFSLQYGQNNQFIINGAIGGGLAEGLRARIAGKLNRDDGWQKNLAVDPVPGKGHGVTRAWALRGNIQADVGEATLLEIGAHYMRNRGTAAGLRPYWIYGGGVVNPDDPNGFTPTSYCGGFATSFTPGDANDAARAACLLANQGVGRQGQTFPKFASDEVYSDRDNFPFEYDGYGGYAKIESDLNFANLTSITGYEHYEQLFEYGFDGWDNRPYGGLSTVQPVDILDPTSGAVLVPAGTTLSPQADWGVHFDSRSWQFSQELRLDGEFGDNKWLLGAYYYRARQGVDSSTTFNESDPDDFLVAGMGGLDPLRYTTKTRSFAFFGQLDAAISETVTMSAGARYTHDRREFLPIQTLRAGQTPVAPTDEPVISGGALSGRLALEYRPGNDALYYAAYSHGFKSGGFNNVRNPAQRGPVTEEEIDNFEVGLKTKFWNGRVRLNAAAFYYKFKGLQALVGSTLPSGAVVTEYINAGNPRTFGLEVEMASNPLDNLDLVFNVGLLDSKIKAEANVAADGRSLDGNVLANAPEASFSGLVRYTIPLGDAGNISLQADGRYQTSVFTGVDNDPAETVDAYGILNVRVGWSDADDRLSLEAFIDNVTDTTVLQHMFALTSGSFSTLPSAGGTGVPAIDAGFGTYNRPRLWGVRAGVKF